MSDKLYHILLLITSGIMINSLVIAAYLILHEINKVRSHKTPLVIAFFAIIFLMVFVVLVIINIWNK
jgi:hypothetical protein